MLGAGDAFMSGFLRGWLRGEPLETCATWANACGAFAVSRLLCSPEYPTWEELQYFLKHGSPHRALRKDEAINHIHWATTRRPQPADADGARHRPSRPARGDGRPRRRAARRGIAAFKVLAVKAAAQGRRRPAGLRHAARRDLWPRGASSPRRSSRSGSAARSSCRARGRCASSSARTSAAGSSNGRSTHTVKCLGFYHPDDDAGAEGRADREAAARCSTPRARYGRELLVEIIAGKHGPLDDDDRRARPRRALRRRHQAGLVEARAAGLRRGLGQDRARSSRTRDPWCRGVVLLGLEAPERSSSAIRFASRSTGFSQSTAFPARTAFSM